MRFATLLKRNFPLLPMLIARCVTVPSNIVSVGPNTYTLNMTGVDFANPGQYQY